MVKTLTSNAGSVDSVPGRGTIIPQAVHLGQIFFSKRRDIGAEAIFKEVVAENFLNLVKVQTTEPRRSTNSV